MRDEVGGDEAATDASSDAVTEDEEEEEEEDNAEGEEVVVVVMPEVEVEVEVPDIYVLEVVKEFDHDHLAFTQGFLYNQECSSEEASCKDMFYESTGLNGEYLCWGWRHESFISSSQSPDSALVVSFPWEHLLQGKRV
mmetsp:Transcript_7819/g.22361  ORF Transcript_7819/g.22361 Transcript_7819/m.22361 type:complete len:138 (-) Transcript_7819:826-1239(-)